MLPLQRYVMTSLIFFSILRVQCEKSGYSCLICMLFAVWYLLITISFRLLFQKRDILIRTKQVRDALRIENVKLRQKCGLLGNEPLLRDYEQRKEQVFTESTLWHGLPLHKGFDIFHRFRWVRNRSNAKPIKIQDIFQAFSHNSRVLFCTSLKLHAYLSKLTGSD